jgi:hypothetical protein
VRLVAVALAASVACGHHEPTSATRPIANSSGSPPSDASIDADEHDACLVFFATYERSKACVLDANVLRHYLDVEADLRHAYNMDDPHTSPFFIALFRRCAEQTAELISAAKAPCGW